MLICSNVVSRAFGTAFSHSRPSRVPASDRVKFFSRSLLPNRIAAGEEPRALPSFLTVTWFRSLS